jgi:hypothetical protein
MAREQVIENRTERIDVGSRVDRIQVAARLLGRHVGGCSEHRARDRHQPGTGFTFGGDDRESVARRRSAGTMRPSGDFRETPVHHVNLAEPAAHDVLRLEVAMDHSLGVGIGHRFGDFDQRFDRAARRPAEFALARAGEHFAEMAAAHQSHREIEAALRVHSDFVQRHDARMIELPGDLRFLEETRQSVGVDLLTALVGREQHFHRERAAEVGVMHFVDRAHPAAPDFAFTDVALAGFLGAGHRGGVGCAGAFGREFELRIVDGNRQS